MATLNKTIAGRITLGVLAIHIFLLPTLYFGLVYLLKENNEELFLNTARGYARFLADDLERLEDTSSAEEVVEILDTVVLSGIGVYSRLDGNNMLFVNSLIDENQLPAYQEDFAIGEHDDNIYFISVPVSSNGEMLSLKVGFDETPHLENNIRARQNGLVLIAIYLAALLLLLPFVSRRIVHPVKSLQLASREIASGDLSGQLKAESDLVEFVGLAQDLELMKNRLIGINNHLQREIREREQAENERRNIEGQLRHSQRLETVGTMAGGIAHELNNILVPIILYTEMAIEDLPDENTSIGDMNRVLNAAKRAKGLVAQVLTFSRKMASQESAPVRMADVVNESTDLLKASLPPTATLQVEIADDCPLVLGDSALMNQLALNLLTNAVQSLGNTKGKVQMVLDVIDADARITAKFPALAGQRLVRLAVSDTGHGMNKATLDRIFEPFFTTRGIGAGTGLGLSVVHGIVNDLKGAIEVESALESGSSFIVYFPAFEEQSKSETHAVQG